LVSARTGQGDDETVGQGDAETGQRAADYQVRQQQRRGDRLRGLLPAAGAVSREHFVLDPGQDDQPGEQADRAQLRPYDARAAAPRRNQLPDPLAAGVADRAARDRGQPADQERGERDEQRAEEHPTGRYADREVQAAGGTARRAEGQRGAGVSTRGAASAATPAERIGSAVAEGIGSTGHGQ